MQYIYLANAHRKLFELSDGIRTLMSGSHLSLEILLPYFTAMHKNCAPPPANSRTNHGMARRWLIVRCHEGCDPPSGPGSFPPPLHPASAFDGPRDFGSLTRPEHLPRRGRRVSGAPPSRR